MLTLTLVCALSVLVWGALLISTVLDRLHLGHTLAREEPPVGEVPEVVAIVPARDEAHQIALCVRSLLASTWPRLRVIVVDDRSSDGTFEAASAIDDPRLTVLHGAELPAGWLGKNHANHEGVQAVPVLREARKQNPDLFLFSSPWSPPGWMKPNNSMIGGAMRKLSFDPYARYFVKFLEAYKAEGIDINAVTVQNESDAEQEGHMPACLWAQEQEMEFAARFLAPALRKAGLAAKIWLLDHNYSLWGRAIDELSDPSVYDAVDGIAWHGYVGEPTAMTRVHEAFPAKNAYWTEGGPDVKQPDYQTDYTRWANEFNGILNNWARSITAWNVALDEKGRPDIGPFSCGGVITIDNATRKITTSGQYWAFAHYSKHIKRGARVFATNALGDMGKGSDVSHSGFRNPDGSFVVVLANKGAERRAQLLMGSQALDVDLPADSVQTLHWS